MTHTIETLDTVQTIYNNISGDMTAHEERAAIKGMRERLVPQASTLETAVMLDATQQANDELQEKLAAANCRAAEWARVADALMVDNHRLERENERLRRESAG